MAAELVNSATSHKLAEVDWSKNIEICEYVAKEPRLTREVVKTIKKRLGSKHPNSQMFSVLLLEMLMNNIGEQVHKQVIDTGVLSLLVKIVKKKANLAVREKIFLLLDATQTSLGGAGGLFPAYFNAYYDLVRSGVKFSSRSNEILINHHATQEVTNESLSASSNEECPPNTKSQDPPESSIIEKAAIALGVLKDVLDAIDPHHPQGAADEFTLDLVEQCSFQKQRVMHLAMSSTNEEVIDKAIELNDELQKALQRHDSFLSVVPTQEHKLPPSTNSNPAMDTRIQTINRVCNAETGDEDEEEEEPEQLFRRLRKGKACVRSEDDNKVDSPTFGERQNRPLIRSLPTGQESPPPPANPPTRLPPPPVKHVERERFFQENGSDAAARVGHRRMLSIHSHTPSSSRSGSIDFSS